MGKFIRDCLTGVDGSTFDLGRALWGCAATPLVLIGMTQVGGAVMALFREPVALKLWDTQDWVTWTTATSGLLVAGAGALYMKRGVEPANGG